MRTTFRLFTALTLLTLTLFADARQKPTEKYRVLISTDIGGTDPDDNQSLAHLMMYSDEFELEGLVSSPSFGSGSAKEIYRMIDVYEQDYPTLKSHVDVMAPDALRKLVKQGRTNELPPCGYAESTEGSEWIVKQARKDDPRPLYVLVWGCLEDVAQALHDAPDIAKKIRVYWIGGPNKKWGVNGYCYIIEHFPDLWMIENNTTYRAFIYDPKNQDKYNMGFFETFIKDAGNLGRDFADYYKGNPKLGDTPSLLYMMDGDPSKPEEQSWGGKFVRCNRTAPSSTEPPQLRTQYRFVALSNGSWKVLNVTTLLSTLPVSPSISETRNGKATIRVMACMCYAIRLIIQAHSTIRSPQRLRASSPLQVR